MILLNESTNTINQTIIPFIKKSYFDKKFSILITTKYEVLDYKNFSIYDLLKYSYLLIIIYKLSNLTQEKAIWLKEIHDLLQKEQIQFIIAKSILSCNEELCNLIFEISQINNFPKDQISNVSIQK